LEKRLQPEGDRVTWSEFNAGPQLLEGLNAGSIDFGVCRGDQPIFGLAVGANLVYTAYELPTPQAEGFTKFYLLDQYPSKSFKGRSLPGKM
jgi:sulfonate transport system substrate-binding protein